MLNNFYKYFRFLKRNNPEEEQIYNVINWNAIYFSFLSNICTGIFNFSNIQKDNALELVHVIPGNTLYPLVDTVFNEGVKSSHQIKVSQKARSIIDTYLNPPIEDDLPF